MNASKAFCARPGCRLAFALHNRSAKACAGYIDPDSAAGRAILRAEKSAAPKLSIVETPPPSVDTPEYVSLEFDIEETTVVDRTRSDAEMFEEWRARAIVLGALS